MKSYTLGIIAYTSCAAWSHAVVTVSDPSTAWTPMIGEYDYLADQQTGDPASDIVGSGINYGMFSTFNDNGSASATDGTLGFRLRLDDRGGNKNVIEFQRNAWIGIDADMSGSIHAAFNTPHCGRAAGFSPPGNHP